MKQMQTWSPPRYLMAKATPVAERNVRADDAVAAEEVEALVEHVHRAALTARAQPSMRPKSSDITARGVMPRASA
jgi:hypothetical protein